MPWNDLWSCQLRQLPTNPTVSETTADLIVDGIVSSDNHNVKIYVYIV